MSSALGSAQSLIAMLLWLAALGMQIFALVDAARRRPDAFVAADKRTKNFWLVILGLAALVGFVSTPLTLLGIAAVVGAGVYLADVRPALQRVTGGGGRRQGPYGPW